MKNTEGDTPLSLAKKQGNDVVAKALKAFGTRPLPLAHSNGAAGSAELVIVPAPPAIAVEADEEDDSVEPARTCFPDFAYNRSGGSKDRVHVIVQRLLEIARKMMRTCIGGDAPLMRQSLLEWNSCISQYVWMQVVELGYGASLLGRYQEAISALVDPPLTVVAASGALINSSGHSLLSLAAISGCAQSVVNCFDAGNQAPQRDLDGQHALQLALM